MSLDVIISLPLLATTFITLFVIMDPPGTVPVFLALTRTMDRQRKNKAAFQATLTSFGVIVGFAVAGKYLLQGLQISMDSLQLSGGILLFLVAMELLMGKGEYGESDGETNTNVAMVPLGTPLLAGPGAIVAVMVSVNQGGGTIAGWVAVLTAVVLMHVVIYLTMRWSVGLAKILGDNGVLVLTKISGVLLAAIATQLVVDAAFHFVAAFQSGAIG